jgi:hypothetical protein
LIVSNATQVHYGNRALSERALMTN